MSIGVTLRQAIIADSGVNALVGTRVYPLVFPAGVTFPCITYRIVSGLQEGVQSEDVYRTRVQFDIWSYSYDDTAEVKDSLLDLFSLADMTVSGQHIIFSKPDLIFDVFDEPLKLHRAVVDISVIHEDS